MSLNLYLNPSSPREGHIPVKNAALYVREIGQGQPLIILHGGPDFDHSYLVPELDRLSDSFRLIYYDQRGRGKSAGDILPKDVSLASEMEDLDGLREHFQLETVAVLGHSWGGLLAMEYAVRHPDRVSHLVLMNTAPASHDDYRLLRQHRRERAAADIEELKARSATAKYRQGDPDAAADYYRIHFRSALRQPAHLEQVVERLRSSFTQEVILKGRAIEDRLMDETWLSSDYNLLPRLERLNITTLVIHGEHDFIPAECAAHVARAVPGARFILLKDCGHFSYLECPDEVHQAIADFFHSIS
jgi:proline iminopeptidase